MTIHSSIEFDVLLKIHKVPLFHYSLCSGLIMTPGFANFTSINESDCKQSLRSQCLGDALSSFLSGLDVCEDIYSIGKAAHAVASYMESSVDIQSRRKTAMNKCSLLLVDRSLDLATASSHSLDSLSGAIYGLLPRMEGHTTDVSVDMSPVFSRLNKCAPKGSTAVPGQIKNEKLFSSFFLKKQKVCMVYVYDCTT